MKEYEVQVIDPDGEVVYSEYVTYDAEEPFSVADGRAILMEAAGSV